MNEIMPYIISAVFSVIAGITLFYLQRTQRKNDKKDEARAKTRQKEIKLMLDLQMATAKLSYATAMAMKRGKANGEVEEGIEAYNLALEDFQEFERELISKI